MTANEMAPEERLAKLDAERAEVMLELKDQRPKAIDTVTRLIKTYSITAKELAPALRKREYKARGPRKPKAAATQPAGLNSGVTSGMSSIPPVAHLGVAA
jgi:DNA-binding protein H-NS